MAAHMSRICRSNRLSGFKRSLAAASHRNESSQAEIQQVETVAPNSLEVIDTENDSDSLYPPVRGKYPPGRWGAMPPKIAWLWEEEKQKISKLRQPLEKIKHLTENEFGTWKFPKIQLSPKLLSYQADKTKTSLIIDHDQHDPKLILPPPLMKLDVNDVKSELKPLVIGFIEQELATNREIHESRHWSRVKYLRTLCAEPKFVNELAYFKVKGLLMTLIGALSGKFSHLHDCHFDENVPISACWSRDAVERAKIPFKHQGFIYQNNAMFHGENEVAFQIRKKLPLPEFLPLDHDLCTQFTYDQMHYKPSVLGQFRETQQRNINPGFNYGDPCEFSHLLVQLSHHHQLDRVKRKFGDAAYLEALRGYGLTTSFVSTLAQAHFQGFNMYEDITYPFTTQTVLTDGHMFLFTAYQLNTIELWKDDDANEYQNLYWVNRPRYLYKEEAGKMVEFNDDTFEILLKFLLIAPSDRGGIDLRPNLGPESTVLGKDKYIDARMGKIVVEEEIVFDKER